MQNDAFAPDHEPALVLKFNEVFCLLSYKVNQKKFMELVSSNALSQVTRMTERGIDPNFQDDKTGGKFAIKR